MESADCSSDGKQPEGRQFSEPPRLLFYRRRPFAWLTKRQIGKKNDDETKESAKTTTVHSHRSKFEDNLFQQNRCKRMCGKKSPRKYSSPGLTNPRASCYQLLLIIFIALLYKSRQQDLPFIGSIQFASASLIIGDSAIEIQEVQDEGTNNSNQNQQASHAENGLPQQGQQFGVQTTGRLGAQDNQQRMLQINQANSNQISNQNYFDSGQEQAVGSGQQQQMSRLPNGPLPPINKDHEDITDGDKRSRGSHDYNMQELKGSSSGQGDERRALSDILAAPNDGKKEPDDLNDDENSKRIAGKVVDFELTPAGGHIKEKVKKKKKMKKEMEKAEAFKKWGKKQKAEKKMMEKKEKEHMKKKKEEGKKKKKKWGVDVHGLKKKGNFKKKKWGEKVKKGKGVKKGKKGKKLLKDKGHKNTGFKTVYHKEEWGKSAKWHDIKREKKWDEKSKKWKKKWKKEKGKKYKGDHQKKFEKQKKEGKKYKKAKKEEEKKFKKEKFEAGKKKKMEEHKKKKEGGSKKMMEEEKKKKKKKKKP